MFKFYYFVITGILVLGSLVTRAQVSVTATGGTTGPTTYTTVKAAFDAINAGTHTGSITVSLTGNTSETATAALNKSGTGAASYTAVVVKPAATVTATIAGNVNGPVLSILGSNVTIDGSNNGSTTRNLTISNLDTSSAKITVVGVLSTGTAPSTNVTIKNSIISKGFTGVIFTDAATLGNPGYFSNVTLQNNSFQTEIIGIFMNTVVAAGNGNGTSITGNDLNSTGAGVIYNVGMFLQGVDGATVSGNNVGNFDPTEDGDDEGIYLSTGTKNTVVDKNKVSTLGYTGTGGYAAHGITVESGITNANIRISNNMISNIFGDGWSYTSADGLDNPIGILLNGTQTGISVVYNSVNLYGNTLNQTGALSVGIYLGPGSAATVVDNIVVNNLGLAGALGYGSTGIYASTSNTQFTQINYNDYWVNPTGSGVKMIGQIGTTGQATLAGWQTASGGEVNSKNVQPNFTSSTDLHLVNGTNGPLENGGTPVVGVTTDFDNETRNATNPDMGADEFAGTGVDVSAPTIAYTALGFSCTTGDRTLANVTISDVSGVATGANAPRIYYKKSTGSTWFSQPGTLTSGTATNGTWSFVITAADLGTITAGDIIQYYVIAQDVAATPNVASNPAGATASNVNTVTTPPSTPNSYVTSANFSGTFTVGTGGTYPTLTAAVNAYNNGCLNGPVTFSLISSTYNTETLPIVIFNPLASATNTLTIKPAVGVSPTISGAATVAVIQLKGADYVTIDGSNAVGGTTKDLTISSTGTGVVPVIWITSGSATDGATNNTIKNIKFTGNTPTTTVGGVIAGGNTLGADAEAPNNANTIQNNQFNRFQNGIYIRGNTTTPDANWNITGNTFGSATPSEKLGFRGMLIGNLQNATVSNNTVTGVVTGATSTSTPTGLIVIGTMNGGLIYNNKISDIKNPNTAGYGSNGIQLSASSTASNLTIYNNFIWDVASYGFADKDVADNGYGIIVTQGGGYNIYHNTVNMNTNQTLAGGFPAAFNVTATVTTPGAINLRDNIFVNSQTAGNTERFAIISSAPNTVFSTINYNDYYSTGPNLGFIGSNRSNLAAIQAGFGGNANSVSIQPVFVSASDLHLDPTTNGTLDNKGTNVGVTTDIDGNTRSTTTPDLGADEFTGASCTPPAITTQPAAQSVCVSTQVTFSVVATGTSLTYQWKKGTTDIAGATSASYTIPGAVAADAASYSVVVGSACGSVTSNTAALTVNTCTAIVPVDEDISSAVLLPNVVHDEAVLRVTARKSLKVDWVIADVQGRVVMKFTQKLSSGTNDMQLHLNRLAGGVYYLTGNTSKGRTSVVPLFRK